MDSKIGHIVQILGTLDSRKYKAIEFSINDFSRKSKLVAESLYYYLTEREKDRSWRVVIIIPESLITLFADPSEGCIEENALKEKITEKFWDSGLVEVNKHSIDIIICPSIGLFTFRNKGFSIRYKNNYGNIVLGILFELLKRVKDQNDVKVFFSITTGHNIYVSATIEALRYLIVYWKLRNMLTNNRKLDVKLVSHDPIIGIEDIKRSHVEFIDYDVKAFFSYPMKEGIKLLDLFAGEAKEEGKNIIESSKTIKRMYNEIKQAVDLRAEFNAVLYNVPLAFLHGSDVLRVGSLSEDEINNVFQELEDLIKELRNRRCRLVNEERVIEVEYTPLNHRNIANILLTQALSISIYNFYKNEFTKIIFNDTDGKWIKIDDMLETFSKVYKNLGLYLNIRFLEREIKILKQYKDSKKFEEKNPISLRDLKNKNSNKETETKREVQKPTDPKRNFFAHCGILDNITLVKKIKGELFIRWKLDSNRREEIKIWLLKPEKI